MAKRTKPKNSSAPAKPDDKSGNIRMWVGAGIGAGIGSAAIAAALLYANRTKPELPKPKGPKEEIE